MRALLLLLTTWLLTASNSALAAEVAVLDFDGYGIPFDDVQYVAMGFRDAFLEEGSVTALDEFDLSNRMSAGYESQLSEARGLFSKGRLELEKGAAGTAFRQLEDALELHEQAGSDVVRRPEMADVYYFTGVAALKTGRSSQSEELFRAALTLYPGYIEHRAPQMDSYTRSALERAASELSSGGRPLAPTDAVQSIAERLQVDMVIIGWIDDQGQLLARMIQNGQIVADAERTSSDIPPFPGDPLYGDMVRELLTAAGGAPSPSRVATTPLSTTPTNSGNEFDDIPTFDPIPGDDFAADPFAEAEAEEEEETEESGSSARSSRRAWRLRDDAVGEISGAKGPPRSSEPVTRRWWFWTATGVVVVGGGATAVYFLTDDLNGGSDGETITDEDTALYTVTVEGR